MLRGGWWYILSRIDINLNGTLYLALIMYSTGTLPWLIPFQGLITWLNLGKCKMQNVSVLIWIKISG